MVVLKGTRPIVYIISHLIVILYSITPGFSSTTNSTIQRKVDSLSNLAKEHHIWAVKHFSDPEMLDSAIVRARLALEIREQMWRDNPNIDLGKSYHNLGTFLKFRGNYKEAKKYLKEAVSVYTTLGHDRVLRSLLELGKIYRQEGDYISAEEYFLSVIKISKQLKNDKKIRDAVVDLGATYIDSRQIDKAINHLETHKGNFNINNRENKNIVGKYYNNLASAYLKNNDYDKAIVTYKTVSLFDTSNYSTQARIYSNLATAYRFKRNFKDCYDALKQGEKLADRSNNLEIMAHIRHCWSEYFDTKTEYGNALRECQIAISILLPTFSPNDDFSNPEITDFNYIVNKMELLNYIKRKANLLGAINKKKHKNLILDLYKLGDSLIDNMRTDHLANETKLYWRKETFPFYEDALKYCYDEDAYEEAFYFMEKSKSVLLQEGYSFNEAISKTSSKDKEKYLELKAGLAKSKSGYDTHSINDIVNAQRNFEMFIDSLALAYPQLFNRHKQLFLLSLDEFRDGFVKDSSTIYIHYFYGKKDVFAFAIESSGYSFLKLGSVDSIKIQIDHLKDFFFHSAKIDNDFGEYEKASYEVYRKLLKPLVEDLHTEVVIIPDGLIATIPFEALMSDISKPNEIEYVIQDRIIRYSFSGSILDNIEDADNRGEFDVVTFVPFGDDQNMNDINFSGVKKLDFDNLEGEGLNVKYVSGTEATKDNLLSFEGYLPILHFSSHGFEGDDEEPKMTLYNSSISLPELYTTFLPSDMVFLSACRTNLGENTYGEGIQSMARGFTFAGANSIVSSLWDVIAEPNSKIVKRFYENLSLGDTKHLALHKSKLAYLQDPQIPLFEKSPYYWAGLVYYGESDHILKPKIKHKTNLKYILGFVFFFSLCIYFWFSNRLEK